MSTIEKPAHWPCPSEAEMQPWFDDMLRGINIPPFIAMPQEQCKEMLRQAFMAGGESAFYAMLGLTPPSGDTK